MGRKSRKVCTHVYMHALCVNVHSDNTLKVTVTRVEIRTYIVENLKASELKKADIHSKRYYT